MADVLKSIMNKITDDDPATRGQQLWVMFTLAIFLVAVLNYYAMVREPDIVEMEDLIEYKNEVVKVEGEIISWREDPWNCLLYTSPSPRDGLLSRMPSSA